MSRSIVKPHYRAVIAIPRALTHGKELVVLTRETYEREVHRAKEIADVLQIVAAGEREHREGRMLRAASLQEALTLHAKRSH